MPLYFEHPHKTCSNRLLITLTKYTIITTDFSTICLPNSLFTPDLNPNKSLIYMFKDIGIKGKKCHCVNGYSLG